MPTGRPAPNATTARTRRSTRRWGRVALIVAALFATVTAGSPAAAAGATAVSRSIGGTVIGTYTFVDCPPGAASGDFCLTDRLHGYLAPLGRVTGNFAVTIHYGRIDGDCAPITKTGVFRNHRGDSLRVDATGTYCNTPAIAAYVIEAAVGSGRLSGYRGTGVWIVPAPTTTTSTGGVGPEILSGTLTRR